MSELLQFLFSGLTVGAMYALAALGYALIYNASHIVNFAQGEFIMLGAMTAAAMVEAGSGLPLAWFFGRTLSGKSMLATSHNPLAASLVGIGTDRVMLVSFAMSGALGAIGGVITAPITFTSYDAGVVLGLKGFAAAALGGIG